MHTENNLNQLRDESLPIEKVEVKNLNKSAFLRSLSGDQTIRMIDNKVFCQPILSDQ